MATTILKPRSSDTIYPALFPLEPISSYEQTTGTFHLSNHDRRSLLDLTLESPDASTHLLSRRSLPDPTLESSDPNTHLLTRRALHTNVIPLSYNLTGAKPGVVVGATLGAVAGFIFLVWLIYTLTRSRGTGIIEGQDAVEEVRIHHRSDRSRRSRRTRTHRSEMSSRSSVPAPPPPRRRERILVEETRRTERSRPPPPPPQEEHVSERETHEVEVEEERRVSGDDVVEVIEEQSDMTPEQPPRRKKSGFRTVDPNAYGGGNFAQREIPESGRRSSRRHDR